MPRSGPYRRRKGGDTWHYCKNCTNWPKEAGQYDERATRPTSGEFCNQCLAKERDGNCT
jgi:hypothetical protein